MTEQNKNEVKWREEFHEYFFKGSEFGHDSVTAKYIRDNSDNYKANLEAYLAARKAAQVEIDELKSQSHILSSWEEMKVKLKSLEQENKALFELRIDSWKEINRLNNKLEFFKNTEIAEMVIELEDREEMIREAIDVLNYCGGDSYIQFEKEKSWLEKAKRLLEEK